MRGWRDFCVPSEFEGNLNTDAAGSRARLVFVLPRLPARPALCGAGGVCVVGWCIFFKLQSCSGVAWGDEFIHSAQCGAACLGRREQATARGCRVGRQLARATSQALDERVPGLHVQLYGGAKWCSSTSIVYTLPSSEH